MPKLEVTEEQILKSLDDLSPAARREALRRLLASADYLDQILDRHQERVQSLARERGVAWDALSDEQRETLIDDMLHEAPRRGR